MSNTELLSEVTKLMLSGVAKYPACIVIVGDTNTGKSTVANFLMDEFDKVVYDKENNESQIIEVLSNDEERMFVKLRDQLITEDIHHTKLVYVNSNTPDDAEVLDSFLWFVKIQCTKDAITGDRNIKVFKYVKGKPEKPFMYAL